MKKTLISIVLIVSLLSTALFSVVFAAYSVEDSGEVTATVSAFGVQIAVTEGTDLTLIPGGSGTLIEVEATGDPTVDATLKYTAEVTVTDWLLDDGTTFYCPVEFTITKPNTNPETKEEEPSVETTVNGANYATAAALAEALEKAITGATEKTDGKYTYTADVNATEDSIVDMHDVAVTWAWADGDAEAAAMNGQLESTSAVQIKINASIVQD